MPATPPAGPATLAGFALDEARSALVAPDGAAVPLRPKTFALLRLLLRQRGEVVGRQQILDEVWAGLTVTDDNVTQCIGEIRRALGEEGGRLLRTVPKRGYVLAAAPEAAPARHTRPMTSRPYLLWVGGVVALLSVAYSMARPQPPPTPVVPAPVASAPNAMIEARGLFDQGRTLAYSSSGDRAGNWLSARRLFERAMAADPRFADAYVQAAFTHTNMVTSGLSADKAEDLRQAATLAAEAARLAPNLPVVHSVQAAVLRLQRRPAEALEAYRRAVLLDPGQHASRANIGLMLILTGRPQEAMEPVLKAMALAEANHSFVGTWLTYLGIAELQSGQGDLGAARFRRSLDRAAFLPADTRRLYLAAALALQNHGDEARVLVSDVLVHQPQLTISRLRQEELSDDPLYLTNQVRLYQGLRQAGLPD